MDSIDLNYGLQVISNSFDVSNLREDDIMPGAASYGGEKYFICLCKAEKKAKAQMQFNSQVVWEQGAGRYVVELAYLGSQQYIAADVQLGGLRLVCGPANIASPWGVL